jgi:CheY-like chemotaxis protein
VTRILVVEDEPLIAMLLVDWLRELGYEPTGPASTMSEALDLIVGSTPDAAIVDVSLNGECCYPVAHALRERDIPFVFATGHDEALGAPYAGAPILPKPFDFQAVKEVLARLLIA